MPANTVKINNHEDFEWVVGDSKMDELIKWLEDNGERMEGHIPDNPPESEPSTDPLTS